MLSLAIPLHAAPVGARPRGPAVAISSPDNGLATNADTLDVTVEYAARPRAKPAGKVTKVVLKLDGDPVEALVLERGRRQGAHSFPLDLSGHPEGLEGKAFSYPPDALLFPTEELQRWARRKLRRAGRIVIAAPCRELYEGDLLGRVWLPMRDEHRQSSQSHNR